MHTRKKLLLSLAAAALCAAAAVPFAQSGEVFVPELATIGVTMCATPAKAADSKAVPSAYDLHVAVRSAQLCGDADVAIATATKLGERISIAAARENLALQPMKAAQYHAHAQFSDPGTVMRLPRPSIELPYVETAWRYARGIALAQASDLKGAARELEELERL